MRRIVDGNIIYVQDGFNFSMYVLDNQLNNLLFDLCISKTSDYDLILSTNEEYKSQILLARNNLFYQPFMLFMADKDQITIQDDLGYDRYGKQLTITKNLEEVKLLFEYEKEESLDKFGIHTINIVPDGRSLIDQQNKDTKERLHILCNSLYKTFGQYEPHYDGPVLTLKKRTNQNK